MKNFRSSTIRSVGWTGSAGLLLAALPWTAHASTYGSGSFGGEVYNGASAPLLAVGPIVLPNTGSTWVALGAAAGVALLGGITAWRRAQKSS